MNIIQTYPKKLDILTRLIELEIYVNELLNEQIQKVKRFQAIFLESIGFKIFTPRTGCMMCPFPVKHGYIQEGI
ncbi:hypothetical protein BBR47_26340 [Brevibacillus brevis NBRC 100599]|uniref:Uncharacterized protein n=2 Tax=Brevibacillus brevis TaxID=1393 RepID=C0ZCV2_BREBN|nr:hypothetical protein BBR47_26340 [Brevibacillus brevis NBRC 100599]